ncbi:MAG: hypothetical protein KatS3mg113_0127 [Planctomycetaceae bacterium]|nr:MAG: hypothetical protein KatS3mg113_0127 [Planctomycetaceae bacterium]
MNAPNILKPEWYPRMGRCASPHELAIDVCLQIGDTPSPGRLLLWVFLILVGWPWASMQAAPSPEVLAKYGDVIVKGRERLMQLKTEPGSGEAALAAYALLKAGLEPQHPIIQQTVLASANKVATGAYDRMPEPTHHIYEAACDAMLLADFDPLTYRSQLENLRDYFVRKQLPNGAWFYPQLEPNCGDTSISQFAILGLWAVSRAGIDVPVNTWVQAGRWFLGTQRRDGGYNYQPHKEMYQKESVPTMTAAGLSSLLIIRMMLYQLATDPPPSAQASKKYGVLEKLADDQPKAEASRPPANFKAELDEGIKRAATWLAGHYVTFPRTGHTQYMQYFHYACERVGTLLQTESFGTFKWYDLGAEALRSIQHNTGEWWEINQGEGTAVRATAFALLFYSRATQTIYEPPQRGPQFGTGLLAGGRGLPEQLGDVRVERGKVQTSSKPQGDLEQLLAQLESTTATVDESVQNAIVEAVQLENRELLIGQVDRLKKLIRDPRPEVRQVAAWALSRSDDLSVAPWLITALRDPDPGVVLEASLGLCVLSRQPQGLRPGGPKSDPLPPEPPLPGENEPPETFAARLKTWQEQMYQAWSAWYLDVRPYDERDDQHALRKRS